MKIHVVVFWVIHHVGMVLSRHQNGGQNHNLLIANKFLKVCQSSSIW